MTYYCQKGHTIPLDKPCSNEDCPDYTSDRVTCFYCVGVSALIILPPETMAELEKEIRDTVQSCRDYDDNDEETTKRILEKIQSFIRRSSENT